MRYEHNLIENIVKSDAFKFRESEDSPAFWYPKDYPFPYYFSVTKMIPSSQKLIEEITNIINDKKDIKEKSQCLWDTILKEYNKSLTYKTIIALLKLYIEDNLDVKNSILLGLERKDWLFSIPLAYELNLSHAFLFKTGEIFYTKSKDTKKTNVFYIADVINYGNSIKNYIIPIKERENVNLMGVITMAIREKDGVELLEKEAIKFISPIIINMGLFNYLYRNKLITNFQYKDIVSFYANQKNWTIGVLRNNRQYILDRIINCDIDELNRFKEFFFYDDLEVHNYFPDLYKLAKKQILIRLSKEKIY